MVGECVNGDGATPQVVHHLFEEHARRAATAAAVRVAGGEMSYGEVNAGANRLARHLKRAGVRSQTRVGIYLPRSSELMVAILGVLKAGATCVPLDPGYPTHRTRQIIDDAEPAVVIALSSLHPIGFRGRVVELDVEWPALPADDDSNRGLQGQGNDVAYVIYTSGSTGTPKGTLISHSALCNYHRALGVLSMASSDVYLCTASIAFSSSVRQLLMPLCQGASVVIATEDELANPVRLFAAIREKQVTIADLVPSYWRACTNVIARLPPDDRSRLLKNKLRMIVSASEPLPAEIPRTWRHDFHQSATFVNGYGHTETTGLVSLFEIPEDLLDSEQDIPIGPPLPNTYFQVLDETGGPVAIGGTGELYVRGASLARGYLNRPELDAETFVWGLPESSERYYRTGDIVRRLSEQTMAFVGRRDQRVKINGVRVEIGDIESGLRKHPAVEDVAVAFHGEDHEGRQLVAYVVPRTSAALPAELRAFLAARLPQPMIPGEFRLVSELPRTASGKLDRAQLRTLAPEAPAAANNRPSTALERALAAEWGRVLRVDHVDSAANFFELGGDSLKAMELVAALQDKFRTEVPMLALFFEEPTIAALAIAIQQTSSHPAALESDDGS